MFAELRSPDELAARILKRRRPMSPSSGGADSPPSMSNDLRVLLASIGMPMMVLRDKFSAHSNRSWKLRLLRQSEVTRRSMLRPLHRTAARIIVDAAASGVV